MPTLNSQQSSRASASKKLTCAISAALVAALSAFTFFGCSSSTDVEKLETDTGLTGGVAATVNGEEIPEDDVTRAINNFRINNSYDTEETWKEYLENSSNTPESVRDDVLDSMIQQKLIVQYADQRGATTSEEEISSYVDKMRANYSSDEAWQTALEGAGFDDEQDYRDALEYSILQKKLTDQFGSETDTGVNESDVVAQAQAMLPTWNNAKRSSHILFNKDDIDLANEVLAKLKLGDLEFADAARTYSKDVASAENGGDVGWDKLTTFVAPYQEAVDRTNVGEITDELVESDYGYHIIQVTDQFYAPDQVNSLSELPTEFVESLTNNQEVTTDTAATDALEEWVDQVRETADIVINPMPENVPYNVNMDGAESQAEQEAIDEEASEELTADVAEDAAEVEGLTLDGNSSVELDENGTPILNQ